MQLRHHQSDFEALNSQIVTITFEAGFWNQAWLQETRSPFPLLRDPDRQTYRAFGLMHSAWRSWEPRTLWYYWQARQQGRKLYPGRGDPNQLGGDVILKPGGHIHRVYRSRSPLDRPQITDLLQAIQGFA